MPPPPPLLSYTRDPDRGSACRMNCESVRPLQGSKSPKSNKEGFGVKKLPFPSVPEMGALSQKSPFSLWSPVEKWGFFDLKAPMSGTLGNGSFLTPKPSFPDFGDFDPCTLSQPLKPLLGEKNRRTKVPRIFQIFGPNFAPNFAPNFPRIFWGVFVLRVVGNGNQKKFTKNPHHFSMQNSQANTKKIFTKSFWRGGQVTSPPKNKSA